MPERMLVHVLLFKEKRNDHLEIVLERQNKYGSLYYNIDQWSSAKDRLSKTVRLRQGDEFVSVPYAEFISSAEGCKTLEITADLDEIIQAWTMQQSETTQHCHQAIGSNCADAVIWFLNRYANMPKPSWETTPVTCNHAFFCCFVPSVFNCISIPDRVMGHIETWLENRGGEHKALKGNAL